MSNIKTVEDVVLDSTMSYDDIVNVIAKECKKEDADDATIDIQFHCKQLSTDVIVKLYKHLLADIDQVHNSTLVMNIMTLLKNYNTFDSSYFADDRIFINDIAQLLDIKLALKNEIDITSGKIANYFISLFRSANKFEYTMLDSYVDLPPFYNMVFMTYDLQSICTILGNVKQDHNYETSNIRNAHMYISHLAKTYATTSDLVESFLTSKGIKQNG